jgi:hypothetical protein
VIALALEAGLPRDAEGVRGIETNFAAFFDGA